MAKKKQFDQPTVVRELAREVIGTVRPTRLVPDKRNRKPKHSKRESTEEME